MRRETIRLVLFATLTTVCALVAVLAAGLAIRSFKVGEALFTDRFVASSNLGRLYMQRISADPRNSWRSESLYKRWDVPAGTDWDNRFWSDSRPRSLLGFAIVNNRPSQPPFLEFYIGPVVVVPYWFPIAAGMVLAFGFGIKTRRLATRRREGRCARCGYDLRATPTRCPECGAEPTSAPRAAA